MTYRLLDYPWHIGHQYEMLKFPFVRWSWLLDYRRANSQALRGNLQDRFTTVPHYEPGAYDAAILHLDQSCANPEVSNLGKGRIYTDLNSVIQDIPKIVIMHGTPHPEGADTPPVLIDAVKQMVGDNPMVVNSHAAAEQWGFGTPIIHGLDADEWFDLPKEPRVVTTLSPGGMDSYYDRAFLAEVKRLLAVRGIALCHIGVDFVSRGWNEYREFLGRSLLYFNPTKASPMPRARTEAMLSGCCILTTPHQDADTFIVDGSNGFLVPRDADYVADLIDLLLREPARAAAIGHLGRETALSRFSWNRYAEEWRNYLGAIITKRTTSRCATPADNRKVGILTYEQMWGWKDFGSSRIRGRWVVKHWPDAEIFIHGNQYSAIIFQKAYWLQYARYFKGVRILDLCDPDFLDWRLQGTVLKMMRECDAVTTSSAELAEYCGKLIDKPVFHVPDRIDFQELAGIRLKVHEGRGRARTIAWYGYAQNYPMLESMLPAILDCGVPELIVIAEGKAPFILPRQAEGRIRLSNRTWNPESVSFDLLEADIVINPRSETGRWRFKSNNKTVFAWALGLPVAHSSEELASLLTETARVTEAARRQAEVREKYDIRLSVDEYRKAIAQCHR